jgi:hypothetical protein
MKGFKLYIGIIVTITLIVFIGLYNKPLEVDWTDTLSKKDKIPFGTYVLHQNINTLFSSKNIKESNLDIYRLIKNEAKDNHQILVISKSVKMSKTEFDALIKWIEKGNKIFIATYNFDNNFSNYFKFGVGTGLPNQDVDVTFTNPQIEKEKFTFTKNTANLYFTKKQNKNQIKLAVDEDGRTNFIAFKIKKGTIYLSPNPLIFSNFNLINNQNRKAAANMLSYLSPDKSLIISNYYLENSFSQESILSTIFKFTALKWAYYIALFTLLLYILVNVKRRQRAIPIITPLQNTSLNFVNTISQIYFQQKDHTQLSQKKINHFLEFVKQKYRLHQTDQIKFIEQLSAKSGVDEEVITKIIIMAEKIKKNKTSTELQLIEISNLIDKFYGNAA